MGRWKRHNCVGVGDVELQQAERFHTTMAKLKLAGVICGYYVDSVVHVCSCGCCAVQEVNEFGQYLR